ncbi:hypothetical protein D3C85_1451390 [compost metagenome]
MAGEHDGVNQAALLSLIKRFVSAGGFDMVNGDCAVVDMANREVHRVLPVAHRAVSAWKKLKHAFFQKTSMLYSKGKKTPPVGGCLWKAGLVSCEGTTTFA